MNDVLDDDIDNSALDAFLPESALEHVGVSADDSARVDPQPRVEPLEVILEPIEVIWQESQVTTSPASSRPSSQVQVWPMLAAALVALGVATLVLAVFAKYSHI